jgi:hypothetical protein
MKAVDISEARHTEYNVRGGSSEIIVLLERADENPIDYLFTVQRVHDYFYTPRHRHTFDQFRISLEGDYNVAPKINLRPGHIAYFPEGAYYGPQKGTPANVTVTLQFQGPSRIPYMSYDDLLRGHRELAPDGEFHGGVFTRVDASGKKHNRDAHDAVWEHIMRQPVRYPKPRYAGPVVIQPENFRWSPRDGGGMVKHLGSFTEDDVSFSLVRCTPDERVQLGREDRSLILFVMDGGVEFDGREYAKYSAFELLPGEVCSLRAADGADIYEITLPQASRN